MMCGGLLHPKILSKYQSQRHMGKELKTASTLQKGNQLRLLKLRKKLIQLIPINH